MPVVLTITAYTRDVSSDTGPLGSFPTQTRGQFWASMGGQAAQAGEPTTSAAYETEHTYDD